MSDYGHVPKEHLNYLIETKLKKLKAEEREQLQDLLGANKAGAKKLVVAALEKVEEGIGERLDRTWNFVSGRSVVLWTVPALNHLKTEGDLKKQIHAVSLAEKQGSPKEREGWLRLGVPKSAAAASVARGGDEEPPPPERVLEYRFSEGEMRVRVRLVKQLSWEIEDAPDHAFRTPDIELSMPTDLTEDSSRLVKVFAGYNDARKALRIFLEWLLQARLPTKGEEVANYFVPLIFTEAQARKLAEGQQWDEVIIEGMDAKGRVGEMKLVGKPAADGLEPLNLQDPLVKTHHAAPMHRRTFNYPFAHTDGFVEKSQIQFVIKGRQPHISFPIKTSRPAMEQAVELLRAEVS